MKKEYFPAIFIITIFVILQSYFVFSEQTLSYSQSYLNINSALSSRYITTYTNYTNIKTNSLDSANELETVSEYDFNRNNTTEKPLNKIIDNIRNDYNLGFNLFFKGYTKITNSVINFFGIQSEITDNPTFIYKLLSVVLSTLIVIFCFFIGYSSTKNINKATFGLIFIITTPALYLLTLNTVFIETFVLLFLLIIIFVWKETLVKKKNYWLLVLILTLFIVSSPMSIILIGILLVYFVIQLIQKKKIFSTEIEMFLFSLFLYVTYYYIIFRDLMLRSDIRIIITNLLTPFYESLVNFDFLFFVPLVGFFHLLFGIVAIYSEFFNKRETQKIVYLIISTTIVSFLLLFTSLMNVYFLLTLLGLSLAMCIPIFITVLNSYLQKTKLKNSINQSILVIIIFLNIFVSGAYISSSITENTENVIDQEIVDFIQKLDNQYGNLKILSSLETAPIIDFYSNFDSLKLKVYSPNFQREQELIKEAYRSPFEKDVLNILNYFNLNCIIVTSVEQKEFNIFDLKVVQPTTIKLYVNDSNKLLYCLG